MRRLATLQTGNIAKKSLFTQAKKKDDPTKLSEKLSVYKKLNSIKNGKQRRNLMNAK